MRHSRWHLANRPEAIARRNAAADERRMALPPPVYPIDVQPGQLVGRITTLINFQLERYGGDPFGMPRILVVPMPEKVNLSAARQPPNDAPLQPSTPPTPPAQAPTEAQAPQAPAAQSRDTPGTPIP